MAAVIDYERRRFLETAAITMFAGRLGAAEASGAPRELTAIGAANDWINSPRLTPDRLAGKVVLVDFWTYTCINWLRTLPYVRAWARNYREGLVVMAGSTARCPPARSGSSSDRSRTYCGVSSRGARVGQGSRQCRRARAG